MHKLLPLWLGAFLVLGSGLAAQDEILLQMETLSTENGLSSNTVMAFCQDHLGFLWIGTNLGLNRYDGRRVVVHQADKNRGEGPSSVYVNAVCEDRWGRIWMGTYEGVDRFDPRDHSYLHFTYDPEKSTGLWGEFIVSLAILPGHPQTLWIGTADGLNTLDLRTHSIRRLGRDPEQAGGLTGRWVYQVFQDSRDRIWVASDAGLSRFRPESNRFEHFPPPESSNLPDGQPGILAIHERADQPGVLWLGSNGNGLIRFDPDRGAWSFFRHRTGDPRSIAANRVFCVGEWPLDPHRLMVGSRGGLDCFDPAAASFTRVTCYAPGLPRPISPAVHHILKDRAGIYWLEAINAGSMLKFDPGRRRRFETFSPPPPAGDALPSRFTDLAETADGRIWIAEWQTEQLTTRLLQFDPRSGSAVPYPLPPLPPGHPLRSPVRAIHVHDDGSLWIGTQSGLVRLNPASGALTVFKPAPGEDSRQGGNVVESITADRNGNLWLSTETGLQLLKPGEGSMVTYLSDPADPASLSSNHVNSVLQDRSGTIWVATHRGLNRFDPGRNAFVRYLHDPTDPNSLGDNYIMTLFEDRAGRLWVGTSSGLEWMQTRQGQLRFRRFVAPGPVQNNFIMGLIEGEAGDLWVTSAGGLARFEPATGSYFCFDWRDNVLPGPMQYQACLRGRDGRLWFGGSDGVTYFHPGEPFRRAPAPPPLITRILINGAEAAAGPEAPLAAAPPFATLVQLPHRTDTLTVECAAMDLVSPELNQHAWKIDGAGDDWHYLGYNDTFTLSGLSPGRHLLRIKTANHTGRWNERGSVLTLFVPAPLWGTAPFWLAVTGLLLGVALAGHLAWRNYTRKLTHTLADMPGDFASLLDRYDISKRESEIVRLVIRGRSNRQIEEELFISIHTVKTHLYSVYQKMGVKNRLELVNLIRERAGAKK